MKRDNLNVGKTAQQGIQECLRREIVAKSQAVPQGEPLTDGEVSRSAQRRDGYVGVAAAIVRQPTLFPRTADPIPGETVLRVRLSWPPSVNDYLGHGVALSRGDAHSRLRCPCCRQGLSGRVMTYPGKAAKTFRASVGAVLVGCQKLAGRLSVVLTIHAPTKRARDLDNLGKVLLDAMTASGAWSDDSQIDRLEFVRGEVIRGGCVDVSVSTLGG